MSSHEFSEWQAYATKEPIGEDRHDLRLARLLAFLANMMMRRSKKDTRMVEPHEFMPDYWAEEPEQSPAAEPQSWQAQLANVVAWNTALKGKDLRQ